MKFLLICLFLGFTHSIQSQVNNSENTLKNSDSLLITTVDSTRYQEVSNDSQQILPEDKIGVTISLKELGMIQTSGQAELLIGIGSGLIFNFYGTIPAYISSVIPTRKSREKVETLIENNPALTSKDVRKYKSGNRKKRSNKALSGVLIGSVSQLLIVLGLVLYIM